MSRKVLLWALLVALAVALGVHLMDFPGSVPDFQKTSGGGVLLDAVPSFSEEVTYQRLAQYGAEGRSNYAFRNVTVDILLPLSVFPFLLLFMLHALERFQFKQATRVLLLALPFGYPIFDLAENGLVLALLINYPQRLPAISSVLPYVTVVKRAASILALIIPAVLFAVSLATRRRSP